MLVTLWVVCVVMMSLSGCKSSATSPKATDAAVDRDASGGDTSSTACPNDDGMRNKVKGAACTCNAQCSTGFCADGFCCDKACNETCRSCGLPTSLGTCTLTPAGVKPRVAAQCEVQPPSSCGQDGTCDGAGKCRSYESGTVCKPGTCSGDAITNTNVCDGAGRCREGPATVCAPFSCNQETSQCFGTCTSDADCVAGRKCVNKSCGKKMNGALCPTGDAECASGHCADGVCCNTACGGACRSCNLVGLQGTCSPVSAGKGHPLCALQDPSTCGTTGVCDGFGTCSLYPSTTPCGASSCSSATTMNSGRTCDGLGSCQSSEVQQCGTYRCAAGACNSKCMTNADCADGIACMAGSCGLKVDGQKCTANSECQNQHCVDGVCCNTACTGACRSCSLTGSVGKCTMAAVGAADPRATCTDMTAAKCATDGKCDGAGGCRKYPVGTQCAAETCANDVYTGISTCNASGQCIKPNSLACYPYHCNATKCFSACTADKDCQTPNTCGMNGNISSCGPKPAGSPCSDATECASSFCAQGVCCNSACTNACQACNLSGTVGSCTNVASGVDPQGKCTVQPASTCGTTGQCAAGQCARWASGTQCVAASCPTASTRAPPSTCNGTGTCVAPASMNCAPGRCEAAACVNSCTLNSECTAPAVCVNGSCGLIPKGGTCTTTTMCAAGLTCYLTEGASGVCCDTACNGTCESCKLAGLVGTCSPVPAGMADPDPATACVADVAPLSCGLNGFCAGNNTTTNAAGTARCQYYGSTKGCRSLSCQDSATAGSTVTLAATCTGSGTCGAVVTQSCGTFKCLDSTQCRSNCTTDSECVGFTCVLNQCGAKLAAGAACGAGSDCTSGLCAGGYCCINACATNDQCHQAPVCAAGTGTCSYPNAPDNSPCDDGVACTHTDRCTAGLCGGTSITCTNDACNTRTCNGTSTCAVSFTTAPCDDGVACTHTDQCSGGTCGGTSITCTSDTCNTRTCNGTSTCAVSFTAAPCDDANLCTYGDACNNGACSGTAIDCSGDGCKVCDGTSTCANLPDATSCGTLQMCMQGTCI